MDLGSMAENASNILKNTSPVISAFQTGDPMDIVKSIPGLGGALLNQLFPDSYESYEMSIHIVNPDKAGQTDFLEAEFDFTVMPEQISAPTQYRTATVPTFGKNVVIDSEVPSAPRFNLRGSFGFNHKLVLTKLAPQLAPKGSNPFINTVCTGYALCKRLEKLVELSHGNSGGQPYETYLVSKAFNSYWKVELLGVNFVQSVAKNTIWQYDISLVKVDKASDNMKEALVGTSGQQLVDSLAKRAITSIASPVVSGATNAVFSNVLSIF